MKSTSPLILLSVSIAALSPAHAQRLAAVPALTLPASPLVAPGFPAAAPLPQISAPAPLPAPMGFKNGGNGIATDLLDDDESSAGVLVPVNPPRPPAPTSVKMLLPRRLEHGRSRREQRPERRHRWLGSMFDNSGAAVELEDAELVAAP